MLLTTARVGMTGGQNNPANGRVSTAKKRRALISRQSGWRSASRKSVHVVDPYELPDAVRKGAVQGA